MEQSTSAEASRAGASRWLGGPATIALAIASAIAVLVANLSGIATGDDGVGYRATADSLLSGNGFGYFLEDPLTVWPPVWSTLMATVAKVTPLSTMGAAVALNALVAFAVVIVGHRLLRRFVDDERLVLLGTAVFALGPTAIGFGHLLMTDMAFALVAMAWLLALIDFRERGLLRWLVAAGMLVWLGFGLRYVGLVLVGFGGLWVLLDSRRSVITRVRNGAIYGLVSICVPASWMWRNHSIDGTFTGERHPSARGLVDNGFDIAATLGRFLLPGLGNGFTKLWAAIGIVAVIIAVWATWRVLAATGPVSVGRLFALFGHPVGLLWIAGFGYLAYMLYVRTTTALNQLDLRLLFPAYFPLLVLTLALADHVRRESAALGPRWWPATRATVHVWAAANVAAGLVAVVMFAAGNPYFTGNYEQDLFDEVRANPVLEQVPADCTLYSNIPNALYPRLEAQWSPEHYALESSETVPDLEEIASTLDTTPSCLIWIDEQPRYGHLWSLDELRERLTVDELARNGNVTVFRLGDLDPSN